jgi:pimeloyl-ACP methyl ester carboxylesterase
MALAVGPIQLNHVSEGAGPPVLMLHGNPDTLHCWRGVIARLRGSNRCHAIDLPGFGGSTAPPDFDCSLAGQAAFIDQTVNALAISEPLHLVMHDIGGICGLAWAIEHPDRVRSIAITNTFFHADYHWHFWGKVWRIRGLGELANALAPRALFERELRKGSRKLTAADTRGMWDRFTPAARKMVLRLYRATDPAVFAGWEERLLALAAVRPTRVVWGDCDPYIDRKYAERFGTTDVHHLADVGHFVPSEAPERLAALLLELFERAP